MSMYKSNKTLVLFRKSNYDAFIAAFIYWRLFGKSSVRPSDVINQSAPSITFKALDVFEAQALYAPKEAHGFNVHNPHSNIPFMGLGDTLLSIGLGLLPTTANSSFFSYENDETFTPEGPSIEGCLFYFTPGRPLTELLLESLFDAKHLTDGSISFILLNQFFQFYKGKGQGFELDDKVAERIITRFPRLDVSDFEALDKYVDNPIDFMERQPKLTPEMAVRAHVLMEASRALENSSIAQAYEFQTDTRLRLVNTDLVDYPASQSLFQMSLDGQAVFVYRFEKNQVRGRYYASSKGENALEVFPQRPRVGNTKIADYLISVEDFYSLVMPIKLE